MMHRSTPSPQRFRTLLLSAIAILATVATGGAVLAQVAEGAPPVEIPAPPPADSGDQSSNSGLAALSTNCRQSRTNGSGSTAFNWCFSDDGNIVMLEHSAGLEHVNNGTITEGFCLAAGFTQRGVSYGSDGTSGLQPPTYPSATKVVHKTIDDDFRVEQRFVQSAGGKEVIVIMKVKNISDSPISNVFLTRFIDADMSNTTGSDVFVSATRSVAVSAPGSARLELIPKTENFNANSLIYPTFLPVLDEDCYDPDSDARLEDTGDRSMGVQYQLGTIFPDSFKTVRFVYHVSI